jgi:hypothetical protein
MLTYKETYAERERERAALLDTHLVIVSSAAYQLLACTFNNYSQGFARHVIPRPTPDQCMLTSTPSSSAVSQHMLKPTYTTQPYTI